MALPVTITGISTAVACVGPYKSSGGNYYFFGRDGTTATTLQAFKATDPSSSWASVTTKTGFGTAVASDAGYQVTDVIHHAIGDGAAGSQNVKYQTFDMSSDSFVTAETIASGLSTAGQTGSAQYGVSIVVRSNGNAVAFFNGAQTKKSGTNYARVYWSERTGVNTWSAAVEVDNAGSIDAVFPEAVLGASDAVQFTWFYSGQTLVNQRTLTSGNSLQTAGTGNINLGMIAPLAGVSYDNSGTQKIVLAYGNTASSITKSVYFDSGNTPTVNVADVDADGDVPSRMFNDGTDVWCLFKDNSDSDLYAVKSTDNGATWGTRASAMTATVGSANADLSVDGNIYQRGSNYVIPYVVNDNGTLKYNEYVVRTSTTAWAGTAAPSVALALAATATLQMAAQASIPISLDLLANAEIKPLRGTALLAASFDLIANAVRYTTGSAAPSLTTSLAANALRFTPTTALHAISTNLIAAPSMSLPAQATQATVFSLAANALRFTNGLAIPQINLDVLANPKQLMAGLGTLPVELSMLASPAQIMMAQAVLPVSFDLIANATIQGQAGQLIQMTSVLAAAFSIQANAVRYTPTTAVLAATTDLIANAVRYSPISAAPSMVTNLTAQTSQLMAGRAAPQVAFNLAASMTQAMAANATLPVSLDVRANAVRYTPTTAVLAAALNLSAAPVQRMAALATLPAVFNMIAAPVQRMRAQASNQIVFGVQAFATIAGQVTAWQATAVAAVSFALQASPNQIMMAQATQAASFALAASAKLMLVAQAQMAATTDLTASAKLLLNAQATGAVVTSLRADARARLAAYAGAMAELSVDANISLVGSMSSINTISFDVLARANLLMPMLADLGLEFGLQANGDIKFISPIQWVTTIDGVADRSDTIQGVAVRADGIDGIARRKNTL